MEEKIVKTKDEEIIIEKTEYDFSMKMDTSNIAPEIWHSLHR